MILFFIIVHWVDFWKNCRAAEFAIFKLKEMGKITQEDVLLILEEFKSLDVDDSGTLSASDIYLAQS